MAQTHFRSKILSGPLDNKAVTLALVAKVDTLTMWSPVVLTDGSVTAMPMVTSTTNAKDAAVIGVLVRLPRGEFVATVSLVEVVIFGICKVLVEDADVALNDKLVTSTSAGKAAVYNGAEIAAEFDNAEVVAALNAISACFARALTTVSSGANSIVACFVNINNAASGYTAGAGGG